MQAIGRQPHRAPDGAPVHYERHRPEQTTLYRLVQQHAAIFIAQAEAAAGADLPQFVKDEFDPFLECGIRALRGRRPAGAGTTVRLHHPPALQAAPGQRPGPSPGTNRPPDCLCPGSALANERVQTNAAGQVVLKLKTPWRDGTTHLVMSPLEFMQRLAARAIEERPSVARATATAAPDSLPRRAGALIYNFGQAARAGSAARARGGSPGSKARRVRGERCAPPAGAAELGQAAQAGVRPRSGALPELRRRAEDHCGDPAGLA